MFYSAAHRAAAAALVITASAFAAHAQPQPAFNRAPTTSSAALRASPDASRQGFRFVETKPSDLRLAGQRLAITDPPLEARTGHFLPDSPRRGPLPMSLTPVTYPDPRSGWLPRCLRVRDSLSEAALSVSPAVWTLPRSAPPDGLAAAAR